MRAVKLNQGSERAASLWLPDQAHVIRFLKINLVLLAFMAACLGAYRFIFMPVKPCCRWDVQSVRATASHAR